MSVRCTSGPQGGSKPRTDNPAMPTDIDGLTDFLPTLGSLIVGGGVGVIEALADAGHLVMWRELAPHWKGLVYGALGGVAGYLVGERKAERKKARGSEWDAIDAEVEALIEARGACYSLGVMYLVKAGAQALPVDALKPKAAFTCPEGQSVQADGKSCAGLQGFDDFSALVHDDVRPALDELRANRALIDQGRAVAGFNIRQGLGGLNLQRA
ncbi:MAG: hypothetical protein H6701_05475 [Myxococcales bacterium]|nr:hypothetical protein [Myxococcales bacterium]